MGAVLIGVFVASAVEVTEMAIIVVGVGATRGWRSTIIGSMAGLVVLAGLVIGLGQALSLIPIGVVRVVIGSLLLTFGLQWLRKGIIGVAGRGFRGGGDPGQGSDDQDSVDAPAGARPGAVDWTAFVLSFKGVLLEGLEIAFIVVAFGAGNGGRGSYLQAAIGATAAFVVIGVLALLARRRLEQVPGRTLKFGVGGLLTTFGTFWTMEGLGVHWPAGKLSLAWLYGAYLSASLVYLVALRRGLIGPAAAAMPGASPPRTSGGRDRAPSPVLMGQGGSRTDSQAPRGPKIGSGRGYQHLADVPAGRRPQ